MAYWGPLKWEKSQISSHNDDLEYVRREMGVILVSDDEAEGLPDDVMRLDLTDYDFGLIATALAHWG